MANKQRHTIPLDGGKQQILAQLHQDLLLLQGYKTAPNEPKDQKIPPPVRRAFPGGVFPMGAVHEFICLEIESIAASSGFIAGVLSSVLEKPGALVWISSSLTLFPPALTPFGIAPHQVIFIHVTEKLKFWALEEALKCEGLQAVVAEIKELDFIQSRRLQLAVERSGVTAFLLRFRPKNLHACIARWQVTTCPTDTCTALPGLGFPRWKVELLKVRNGKPAQWKMEWHNEQFKFVDEPFISYGEQKRKIV